MKKTSLLLGLAMAFSVNAMAADPFLANLKTGNWNGTVSESVSPALKGKKFTATTESAAADQVKITVRIDGAQGGEREEWLVTPTQLVQSEYDAAGKPVGTPYAANARAGQTNTARTYDVNCTDKAANKCDNGIDAKNNWSLVASGNTLKYIVTGLRDKTKPDSLGTRHIFEFAPAGK